MYDAVIVGAGPAGSAAARELARHGHRTLLVEEHERIGWPVQCGGLLTPGAVELVPGDITTLTRARFTRAQIHAPSGTCLSLRAPELRSIAVDRAGLDALLARLAQDQGAQVRLGTKAVSIEEKDDAVHVHLRTATGDEVVRTRLLVGADGAQSRVSKWAGLFQPRQFVSLHGAQMTGLNGLDEDSVYMWLGRDRAPGFFTYLIPTGGATGKVEAGVWNAERPASHYFQRMYTDPLSRHHLTGAREEYVISATIPFGPAKQSVADRVMLVGDAAGQAKPTTGGGIYPALACAAILADVANAALTDDDVTRKRLSDYHERWTDTIGRELRIGLRLRHAFLRLSDHDIDQIWQRLSKPEMIAIINAMGDIDRPSKVAFALLREEPGLLRYAPPVLRGFLSGVE